MRFAMKSKVGLHKKVSSIFDGMPDTGQSTPNPTGSNSGSAPAAGSPSNTTPATGSAPQAPASNNYTPNPSGAGSNTAPKTPTRDTTKTKPAPQKNQTVVVRKNKKGKTDPHQTKMMVLVGILAVAFIGVLFFALGGSTQPTGKTKATQNQQANQAQALAAKAEITWEKPQPWPEDIRDPMQFGKIQASPAGSQQTDFSECVVKGIVFSSTRPTAIIGDQIVAVGEVVNGITVVKINKDSVEFEKDGETWTQQVQQ